MEDDSPSLYLALHAVHLPFLAEEKRMNQHPMLLYEMAAQNRDDRLCAAAQRRLAAQIRRPRRRHAPGAPMLAHVAHSLGLALDRFAVALCDDCFDAVPH